MTRLVSLTIADHVQRTPEVEAWLADCERILEAEAQRLLQEFMPAGTAIVGERPPGKRYVIIRTASRPDGHLHGMQIYEVDVLSQEDRRLARMGEHVAVDTIRNKELSAKTGNVWQETTRSRLLSTGRLSRS